VTVELADTSALILAHRDPAIGRPLQAAIARDEIAICDIVELEYLMGARNAADYRAMESAFLGFRKLPIEGADWARVRDVHRSLAEAGPGHQRSVRLPDLIIAAVAERHGIGLVHYDEDYDRIAAITGQPTRWVAPRGSVG
jgi:predicted nucleic acid-binding protein